MKTRTMRMLAACVAAAGCATMARAPDVQARLGEDFRLPRGRTAAIAGQRLTVRFTRVVSDSRCPMGVQCIRAGEARVHVKLRLPRRQMEDVVLATAPAQPRYASFGAYDVRLVALEPPRRTDVPHPRYVATLRVTRR